MLNGTSGVVGGYLISPTRLFASFGNVCFLAVDFIAYDSHNGKNYQRSQNNIVCSIADGPGGK